MARSIQRQTDGITIEEFHARFSGRVLLEEEDLNATALEEVGVGVVVFKTDGTGTSINRKGTVIRTAVLKVTDLRVLDGDLKKLLVERLGLYGDDTVELPTTTAPDAIAAQLSDQGQLFGADPETGEIDEELDAIVNSARVSEPEEEPDGIVGSIHAHREQASTASTGGPVSHNGVKVLPFTESDVDGVTGEREVLGRIRQSSDPSLQKFFEEV